MNKLIDKLTFSCIDDNETLLSPGPWLKWSHHLIIFAKSFLLILMMGNRLLESLLYYDIYFMYISYIKKKDWALPFPV